MEKMDVNGNDVRARMLVIETRFSAHETNFKDFKKEIEKEMFKIDRSLCDINKTTSEIKTSMARYVGVGITLIGVAQIATSFLLKLL